MSVSSFPEWRQSSFACAVKTRSLLFSALALTALMIAAPQLVQFAAWLWAQLPASSPAPAGTGLWDGLLTMLGAGLSNLAVLVTAAPRWLASHLPLFAEVTSAEGPAYLNQYFYILAGLATLVAWLLKSDDMKLGRLPRGAFLLSSLWGGTQLTAYWMAPADEWTRAGVLVMALLLFAVLMLGSLTWQDITNEKLKPARTTEEAPQPPRYRQPRWALFVRLAVVYGLLQCALTGGMLGGNLFTAHWGAEVAPLGNILGFLAGGGLGVWLVASLFTCDPWFPVEDPQSAAPTA